jgi:peptide deformylase
MMNRGDDILHYGHAVLRRKAAPVGKLDAAVADLAARLTSTLERAGGLGLAAPQIGAGLCVIAYDIGDGPQVRINPRVAKSEGEQTSVEGCLSLPGLYGEVKRAECVVVSGRDLQGRAVTSEAGDLLARVLQHEIDHLQGVLFVDRVDPDTLYWALGDAGHDDESQRVPTTLEDALKVFEARMASRR